MNASPTPDADAEFVPVKTPPITLCNSSSTGKYAGDELTISPARSCADSALLLPSRVGNRLHHRCGHVTDLCGLPITS